MANKDFLITQKEEWLKNMLYSPAYAEWIGTKKALANKNIYHGMFAWDFIQMVINPFEEWKAYEMGLIDKDGKELRKATTKEEKLVWNYFSRIIAKFKRKVWHIIPKSRMDIITQQLLLVRESNENYNELGYEILSSVKDEDGMNILTSVIYGIKDEDLLK